MSSGPPERHEGHLFRFKAEIEKAFVLTLYFGVWFSSIQFLIFETLQRHGVPLVNLGLIWIKAALCAKFLLIGQMIAPMKSLSGQHFWRVLLPMSLIYLSVVVVLSVLEEGVKGLIHGEPFLAAMAGYAGGNPFHALALAQVYWLILVSYLVLASVLTRPRVAETA